MNKPHEIRVCSLVRERLDVLVELVELLLAELLLGLDPLRFVRPSRCRLLHRVCVSARTDCSVASKQSACDRRLSHLDLGAAVRQLLDERGAFGQKVALALVLLGCFLGRFPLLVVRQADPVPSRLDFDCRRRLVLIEERIRLGDRDGADELVEPRVRCLVYVSVSARARCSCWSVWPVWGAHSDEPLSRYRRVSVAETVLAPYSSARLSVDSRRMSSIARELVCVRRAESKRLVVTPAPAIDCQCQPLQACYRRADFI